MHSDSFFKRLLGSSSEEFDLGTPLHIKLPRGLFNEVLAQGNLDSLEGHLNHWPYFVDVHLPEVADEADTISVNTKEAYAKFKQGMGLLFNDIDRLIPKLQIWCSELQKDLSLAQMTYARALLYATPQNGGTAAHFDQNINFVLQLSGEKTWWLAENKHISSPLTRFTMGQEMDAELASYGPEQMPNTFPEEFQKYELTAGSLLYVPQGIWHKTKAHSDALSLNFTFSVPAWIDLLLASMRSKLILDPRWREMVSLPDEDRDILTLKLEGLLAEAGEDIKSWDPAFIMSLFRP